MLKKCGREGWLQGSIASWNKGQRKGVEARERKQPATGTRLKVYFVSVSFCSNWGLHWLRPAWTWELFSLDFQIPSFQKSPLTYWGCRNHDSYRPRFPPTLDASPALTGNTPASFRSAPASRPSAAILAAHMTCGGRGPRTPGAGSGSGSRL